MSRPSRLRQNGWITWHGAILSLAVATVISFPAFAGDRAPSASQIRRAVEQSSDGCRLMTSESIRLGRFKMWAARQIVGISGVVEPEVREILRAVRKVEVVSFYSIGGSECHLPDALPESLESAGWSRVMTQGSDGDETLVFQHASGSGRLDGLLFTEMSGNELEVVRVHGKIDTLIEMSLDAEAILGALDLD